MLHGLSFDAGRGSVTGLIGPSGCGKIMLMRAIAGCSRIRPSAHAACPVVVVPTGRSLAGPGTLAGRGSRRQPETSAASSSAVADTVTFCQGTMSTGRLDRCSTRLDTLPNGMWGRSVRLLEPSITMRAS